MLEAPGQQLLLLIAGVEPVAVRGRPVATLHTQDARPEQSVPDAESPPTTYGVPETWLTNVNNGLTPGVG